MSSLSRMKVGIESPGPFHSKSRITKGKSVIRADRLKKAGYFVRTPIKAQAERPRGTRGGACLLGQPGMVPTLDDFPAGRADDKRHAFCPPSRPRAG